MNRCPEVVADRELKLDVLVREFTNQLGHVGNPDISALATRFPDLYEAHLVRRLDGTGLFHISESDVARSIETKNIDLPDRIGG